MPTGLKRRNCWGRYRYDSNSGYVALTTGTPTATSLLMVTNRAKMPAILRRRALGAVDVSDTSATMKTMGQTLPTSMALYTLHENWDRSSVVMPWKITAG